MNVATGKILEALMYVASKHPEVTQVTYEVATWCYHDGATNAPTFGPGIDVALLVAAQDEVYISFDEPCTFVLPEKGAAQ